MESIPLRLLSMLGPCSFSSLIAMLGDVMYLSAFMSLVVAAVNVLSATFSQWSAQNGSPVMPISISSLAICSTMAHVSAP